MVDKRCLGAWAVWILTYNDRKVILRQHVICHCCIRHNLISMLGRNGLIFGLSCDPLYCLTWLGDGLDFSNIVMNSPHNSFLLHICTVELFMVPSYATYWFTCHMALPYLIFVIFFTQAKFLENEIYTEKTRKLRQNTQKIANFCFITAKYTVNCQFFALNL